MPAAAVIPAPKAYIKVVAVKKLVVGFLSMVAWSLLCRVSAVAMASRSDTCWCLIASHGLVRFYFEEIGVFTAGIRLDILAWNNNIGFRSYFVGF